jgi:hypothetical protein
LRLCGQPSRARGKQYEEVTDDCSRNPDFAHPVFKIIWKFSLIPDLPAQDQDVLDLADSQTVRMSSSLLV